MNIILTGLVIGLAGAVALLVRDRNEYRAITNETIKELAILEKEYDSLDSMLLEAGLEIMALEDRIEELEGKTIEDYFFALDKEEQRDVLHSIVDRMNSERIKTGSYPNMKI